jgi:regulatory protein YycH of two-component signal transduction system YycFG
MIETLKSAALVLLVGLSLVQSYFLSYSSPNFDPLIQDEYVKTDRLGSEAVLEDLLFPDQLVMHLGNQQHTVMYPGTPAYSMVMDSVKQRTLEGFRKLSMSALNINWEDVRTKQQGVEIRFRDGIPINALQRVMQIKGELPLENDTINRIWIFVKDTKDEVRTILFTDTPNLVYEVQRADISGKDIERFATELQKPDASGKEVMIPYKSTNGDYYLPMQPIAFPEVRLPYKQYTVDQLKRSFFVDPAITRNLSERDGSEIYTDAKRGLQLKNDQRWMTYSDPVAAAATVDNKTDLLDNLLSAVQFVNQHGGWNGTYSVQKVPQRLLPGNQPFIFRQYYGALPIIDQRPYNIGSMKIVLQKGVVASYERSTIIPDSKGATRKEVTIIGGEALDEKLNLYEKKNAVISVFPGYRPMVNEQTIDLNPAWAVELRDGTYEFLD